MTVQSSIPRRNLFARLRGGGVQQRPPWARDEEAFTSACTQCGACFAACPTRIIRTGHAGYPIVEFANAGCTFCGACKAACRAHCFDTAAREPWSVKAVVSGTCVEAKGVSCRLCQDACDVRAIRFRPALGGTSMAAIDADACTGCGACVAPCPVSAIAIKLPEFTPAHEATA